LLELLICDLALPAIFVCVLVIPLFDKVAGSGNGLLRLNHHAAMNSSRMTTMTMLIDVRFFINLRNHWVKSKPKHHLLPIPLHICMYDNAVSHTPMSLVPISK